MHFRSSIGIFADISNDPLVVEDDKEKTGGTDGSTEVTSMEPEIGTALFQSSQLVEKPKTHSCLSSTTTEPITSPFDRPISHIVALFCDRVEQTIRGGNHGAAETVTVHPPHAITVTPLLPEQPRDHGSKWEIVRIVGKKQRGKGYEYKMCWKKAWLPRKCT